MRRHGCRRGFFIEGIEGLFDQLVHVVEMAALQLRVHEQPPFKVSGFSRSPNDQRLITRSAVGLQALAPTAKHEYHDSALNRTHIRAPMLALALASLPAHTGIAAGTEPAILPLEGDLERVHDPAIIRERSMYDLFATDGPPGNLAPDISFCRGPAQESVLHDKNQDYLVFHAYSAANGRSSLQISTIRWEKGWPRVGDLP
jgi:hypothetical protein